MSDMHPQRIAVSMRSDVTIVALLSWALFSCGGCEKPDEEAVVPASDYVQPEAPPTFTAPSGTHEHGLRFTDITEAAGIDFEHVTGAFGKKWMPETMGGGAAFFDYDGDDLPDILLVNSADWPGHERKGKRPTPALFRNRGDGTFEDLTEKSGLSNLFCYGMGIAIADYDADNDADIYITAVGRNHLLRNDEGRFIDVTEAAGVGFSTCDEAASPWEWSTGATWVDYDRDGDLDLFVANYVRWTPETDIWTTLDGKSKSYATPQPYQGATCVLFRNEGDGRFTDVTRKTGVFNPEGKSLSVIADDFNDDGWPDLVVTNDTQPNFLYINATDGTFVNRALSAGLAYDENGVARAGMGVGVADLGNTGRRSVAIGNFSGEPVSLYTQVDVDTYIDRAGATRLSKPTSTSLTFGVLFADLNLDGLEDLVLTNGHIEPDIASVREGWTFAQPPQLFLNSRGGQFVEVSSEVGDSFSEPIVGRALAAADIDADGDLDLLMAGNGGRPRLLRNDLAEENRSIRVKLIAAGKNTVAIGARLEARIDDRVQRRFVTTGGSYLSQSELIATFGLGSAAAIDELRVRWPDGSESRLADLPADDIYTVTYTIRQGEGIVRTNRRRSFFDGAIPVGGEIIPSRNRTNRRP